ncbi:MAG TPA: HAD family hydrolase, partial [Actinomycetota bacterium]|nr:HAD family hydrolase [Actinomycetota bacterium]
AAVAGRRPAVTAVAATAWLATTVRSASERIAPGPRTRGEIATMALTSAAIPFAAVAHRIAGELRARGARPLRPGVRTEAVLFDRDGTLVVDVPYNGDPDLVRPVADAAEALRMLRAAGVATAVITNQSGVARGLLEVDDVERIHRRMVELLGPLGPLLFCPHGPADGCPCRKPENGLVVDAARALGVDPTDCVVVGDTGADVGAARAAGARAILVPNDVTLRGEIDDADEVAGSVVEAVRSILDADVSVQGALPSPLAGPGADGAAARDAIGRDRALAS